MDVEERVRLSVTEGGVLVDDDEVGDVDIDGMGTDDGWVEAGVIVVDESVS